MDWCYRRKTILELESVKPPVAALQMRALNETGAFQSLYVCRKCSKLLLESRTRQLYKNSQDFTGFSRFSRTPGFGPVFEGFREPSFFASF